MIQFKLNGKKVQVASTWHDLTLTQYLKCFDLKDDILQSVSLASGLDYEILKTAKIEGIEPLLKAVSFLNTKPEFNPVVTECGKYKLPLNDKGQYNITFESLAQFEDMRQVMKKTNFDDIRATTASYAKYVAIYLQPIRDKAYDPIKAIEMEAEVLEMPAHQVIMLGSFFLLKLVSLSSGTKRTSQITAQTQKKSKPVSKSSAKRSGRSARSRK